MNSKTFVISAIFTALFLLQSDVVLAASSMGKYSFRLESSSGRQLPTHNRKGYTYVEGKKGQQYSIRVFNHSSDRVEAVVTVDGRNVISGKSGNYSQRGYVISPYSSVLIDGFRTSWKGVAAFHFTDIEDSYAARLGDAANVGVIGVAVFKEKRRRQIRRHYNRIPRSSSKKKQRAGSSYGSPDRTYSPEAESDSLSMENKQGIGTGYGDQQYSPASETSFRRSSSRPSARLSIYYDDLQGLIARGILTPPPPPRPLPCNHCPHPFPQTNDPGFAPPPPPYYWE